MVEHFYIERKVGQFLKYSATGIFDYNIKLAKFKDTGGRKICR